MGKIGCDYLRIAVSNRWSSNWFNADVEIQAGAWSGKYTATFENGELRSFASGIRKLYRELSGSVSLAQKREKYLAMTCKGDGRGHICLSGFAQQSGGPLGPKVFFDFNVDQTELPQVAAALEAINPQSPNLSSS